MITAEQVRTWGQDASENLLRIDTARGLTAGQQHINALLRPRESRILRLCDELLALLEAEDST